ncbi:unnamed protein product [Gordionus sp. m RMFG-2023]
MFKGLKIKKLIFVKNHIEDFEPYAFRGLDIDTLKISEELFETDNKTLANIPVEALKHLTNLKDLLILGSNVKEIPEFAFQNSTNLKELYFLTFYLNKIYTNSFAGLNNLKKLYIASLKLEEISSAIFAPLENLQYLFLSLKSMKTLKREQFSTLKNLTSLNLDHSDVENIEFQCFENFNHSLILLSMIGNRLHDIGAVFNYLSALKDLILSFNKIIKINSDSLQNLTMLESLDLSYNKIKFIGDNVLTRSKNLNDIDIRSNHLVDIPTNMLGQFMELKKFDISKNFIFRVEDYSFYNNYKLKNLDMSDNIITSLYADSFASLYNLEYLDLSDNYLTDIPFKSFEIFQNLKYLNMSKNNLSTFDIDSISKTDSTLKFIGLAENPWNCNCQMKKLLRWYNLWSYELSLNERYSQEENLKLAKCQYPYFLKGMPILEVSINHINCSYIDATSNEWNKWNRSYVNSLSIDKNHLPSKYMKSNFDELAHTHHIETFMNNRKENKFSIAALIISCMTFLFVLFLIFKRDDTKPNCGRFSKYLTPSIFVMSSKGLSKVLKTTKVEDKQRITQNEYITDGHTSINHDF